MNLNTEYHPGYHRILFLCKKTNQFQYLYIMVVSNDKVISIIYELRIDREDGKIIESLKKDTPLTFIYGAGSLLPRFEDHLAGLGIGDKFSFSLDAENAYGEVDHNALVNVPIGAFEVDGKVDNNLVKTGNIIPMQDGNGNRLNGLVKEISSEAVTMDFNHPLAGNSLFFTGQIINIRESTEEERSHGHAHHAGSCEGCSDCSGQEGQCC
jgi:FKBP-type peptidyl-prolyl cis-trans isomerase SlyD